MGSDSNSKLKIQKSKLKSRELAFDGNHESWRDVIELGGGEKNTTNNRMELMAAIQGLKKIQNS